MSKEPTVAAAGKRQLTESTPTGVDLLPSQVCGENASVQNAPSSNISNVNSQNRISEQNEVQPGPSHLRQNVAATHVNQVGSEMDATSSFFEVSPDTGRSIGFQNDVVQPVVSTVVGILEHVACPMELQVGQNQMSSDKPSCMEELTPIINMNLLRNENTQRPAGFDRTR